MPRWAILVDNLDSSKRGQVRVSTASTKNLPTSTAVLMSNWEEGTFLARVGSFSGWRRQSSYPGGEKTWKRHRFWGVTILQQILIIYSKCRMVVFHDFSWFEKSNWKTPLGTYEKLDLVARCVHTENEHFDTWWPWVQFIHMQTLMLMAFTQQNWNKQNWKASTYSVHNLNQEPFRICDSEFSFKCTIWFRTTVQHWLLEKESPWMAHIRSSNKQTALKVPWNKLFKRWFCHLLCWFLTF